MKKNLQSAIKAIIFQVLLEVIKHATLKLIFGDL